MNTAKMGQRGIAKGFLWGLGFLAAGLVIVQVSKRAGVLEPPGGIADSPAPRPINSNANGNGRTLGGYGMPGAMFANAGGVINSVKMGAQLTKQAGATIAIGVTYSNLTRDFQGAQIAWPFQVGVRLIDFTSGGGFGGMVFSPESGPTSTSYGLGKGVKTGITISPILVGQTLKVRAYLFAAKSDANGRPTNDRQIVSQADGDNTIVVAPDAGPADITGTVGAVTVSQNPQFIRARIAGMGLLERRSYITPASMTQAAHRGVNSTNR